MRSGRLRFRVSLQKPAYADDGTGGALVEFVPFATVMADVVPVSGRERLTADQITAEVDTRIFYRWQKLLDVVQEDWRVVHAGKAYDIKFINHVSLRQRAVELLCKSGLSEG